MTKSEAIKIFGGATSLARALGIRRQSIYQWPEMLNQRTADEIRGAALRLKLRTQAEVEQLISAEGDEYSQ